MGDIILTFFLVVTFVLALIFSRSFSRCLPFAFWSSTFMLWFLFWSVFGFYAGMMNYNNGDEILITPIFFLIQSVACLMFIKKLNIGKSLLVLTLILQIPILKTFGFQYHNQTLFSATLYFDWVHNFDTEPGSYLIFRNGPPVRGALWIVDGINLVPIIFIFLIQIIKARSND